MPTRDSAPIGAPCWVDLSTSDPEKSEIFYRELFGWSVDDPGEEYGGYKNFLLDGGGVAGFMRNPCEDGSIPDAWSVYLAVDDAEATVKAAEKLGSQAIVPAMPVMALGTMAVITDAGQATIGIWQPGEHKGFGILAETGAPAWFELHTREYDASVDFYRQAFGWDTHTMSDTTDFRYTTFGEGDDALAGIMDASGFLPDGVPAHWSVYFGVDDTDAALEKVVALGGAVIMPAEDTPYGRLAHVADPTGAMFKLVAG